MSELLSTHRLVMIEWDDACIIPTVEYALAELDQIHAPRRFRLFGLLLKSDEAGVTVAGEEGTSGGVRTLSFVPKQMIKRVIDLGQPRVPSKGRSRASRNSTGQQTAPVPPPPPADPAAS
jgi:hypothetical protein